MSDPKQTHISKVALIGGSGNLGSHILSSLLALPSPPSITILTRNNNKSYPPSVTTTIVDYSSPTNIASALTGHDFLFITLSARAPPDLHPRIVNAAASAGVKYILPNYFGNALRDASPSTSASQADPIISAFDKFVTDVRDVETKGVKWIAMCCGFWYEFSVGMGEAWLGFDIPGRKVTFYGDGLTRINTSTWELCGRSAAALVALPLQRTSEDMNAEGKGDLALENWANKGLYVSSFLVSQRDVLDSLHRVLGTTDAEWTIGYQDVEERYKEGLKELGEGHMTGFAKALYARVFFGDGLGDYETGRELDNGKLGIEKEELDVATKRTVEMVEGGFGFKG